MITTAVGSPVCGTSTDYSTDRMGEGREERGGTLAVLPDGHPGQGPPLIPWGGGPTIYEFFGI